MSDYVLVQEYEFEPFTAEIVAQNKQEGKELVVQFSILHVADWRESSLDDFTRIGGKWKMAESLKKKAGTTKAPSRKEAGEWLRTTRALVKMVEDNGIVEQAGRDVWDTLSITQKTKIVNAWMNWTEKLAEDKKED